MTDVGSCELIDGRIVPISPTSDEHGRVEVSLTQKLREYFATGVRLVWVADPATRSVLAYRSLTDVREFREAERLPGDDVLAGFDVPVAALFEE